MNLVRNDIKKHCKGQLLVLSLLPEPEYNFFNLSIRILHYDITLLACSRSFTWQLKVTIIQTILLAARPNVHWIICPLCPTGHLNYLKWETSSSRHWSTNIFQNLKKTQFGPFFAQPGSPTHKIGPDRTWPASAELWSKTSFCDLENKANFCLAGKIETWPNSWTWVTSCSPGFFWDPGLTWNTEEVSSSSLNPTLGKNFKKNHKKDHGGKTYSESGKETGDPNWWSWLDNLWKQELEIFIVN